MPSGDGENFSDWCRVPHVQSGDRENPALLLIRCGDPEMNECPVQDMDSILGGKLS